MQKRLYMSYPIIQAPMAGVTTPEFVAKCANAGILGSIGAGYLNEEDTRTMIQAVKKLTNQPFSVNLFIPEMPSVDEQVIQQAMDDLQAIRQILQMKNEPFSLPTSHYEAQLNVLIEEQVAACSFTFGLPSEAVITRLKAAGIFLIGTATTKEEALQVEAIGMDAVVLQGNEAGGHRGSFLKNVNPLPLAMLLHEVRDSLQIPMIAAGGLVDRASANRAFKLGAHAIQVGTALLVADESGAHQLHKEAILQSKAGDTVLTKSFSGKMARGLENTYIIEMKDAHIAPYPIQNELTKHIRRSSAAQGKTDYMSLWAGSQAHMTKPGAVEDIIARFING